MSVRQRQRNLLDIRNRKILTEFQHGIDEAELSEKYHLSPLTIRTILFKERRAAVNIAEAIIARAIEIASSGTIANFEQLKTELLAEGHKGRMPQLAGRTLRRQLLQAISAARSKGR